MMLRNVMLRRRINPKTGTHTFCEPAQSKCIWAFHKTHFVWKFTGKPPSPEPRRMFCAGLRCRNAGGHFTGAIDTDIYREHAAAQREPRTRTHILCKPAQSKRTQTFHKSLLTRKFTEKIPRAQNEPRTRTHIFWDLAFDLHLDISQEPFDTEICR